MTQTIIINEKIELTEIRATDKPQFVQYLNNKEHYDYTLHIPSPYTDADADWFINSCREAEEKHGRVVNFAIRTYGTSRENREGALIGGIGIIFNDKPQAKHKAEIGYWIGKPFWGQGIMTEVVRVFSDYWLQNGFVRLEATVFEPNLASKRVLVKAGFKLEGFCEKYYIKPLDGLPRNAFLLSKMVATELAP
jgi:[ribosomal protein S5]-alanine N-acetyltransferase